MIKSKPKRKLLEDQINEEQKQKLGRFKRFLKQFLTRRKKKNDVISDGQLQQFLYLNRNLNRKEKKTFIKPIFISWKMEKWNQFRIKYNLIWKRWKQRKKQVTKKNIVFVTRKSFWVTKLQRNVINYKKLLVKLKMFYGETKNNLEMYPNNWANKGNVKQFLSQLKKKFMLCLYIYLKLNMNKRFFFKKGRRKNKIRKHINNFYLNSYKHLNKRFDAAKLANSIKNWVCLFNWSHKYNKLLDKLIKTVDIQYTLECFKTKQKPNKYREVSFVLKKIKYFNHFSGYGQLRKLGWWFKKEQKDKLPHVIRVKPRVITFEREYKWKRDVSFNSFWFTKLINQFIKRGKKQFAESTVVEIFKDLKFRAEIDAFRIFWKLMVKISPILTTVPKRVGRLYHSIPVPIKFSTAHKIGFKWLLKGIESQGNIALQNRIFNEIVATLDISRSFTIKLRDRLYHVANENRTYCHYRWI